MMFRRARARPDDRRRRRAARVDAVPVPAPRRRVRVSGELSDEVVADRARRSTRSCSASRTKAATPSQRTEFRVAYDATHALREGARVRHRAGQDRHATSRGAIVDSPSDWIRVLIDSYHDQRTAYEFAVNPSGVKHGSLLVQRQQQRRQLGRGVGRQRVARRRRAGRAEFRIPFSQLRFNPSRREHVRLRGVARRSAG